MTDFHRLKDFSGLKMKKDDSGLPGDVLMCIFSFNNSYFQITLTLI